MRQSILLLAGSVLAGIAGAGSLMAEDAGGLRAPGAFSDIADEKARAVALFDEMAKVITHPRCMNCHPRGDTPLQGAAMVPHQPPVMRGAADFGTSAMMCSTCHGSANVTLVGVGGIESVPGHDPWHLAPQSMGWTGLSNAEICAQLKDPARNGERSLEDIHDHMAEDGLVGWAWQPGAGRAPAPGSQQQFGALTAAWIEAGAHCPE